MGDELGRYGATLRAIDRGAGVELVDRRRRMMPAGAECESGWVRRGIEVRLGPGDHERLEAVIGS
jgi:hypothetical protein